MAIGLADNCGHAAARRLPVRGAVFIRRAVICPSNCAADRSLVAEFSTCVARSEEIATPGSRARKFDAIADQLAGITRIHASPGNQAVASLAVAPSVPHQSDTLASGEPVPTLQQRGERGDGRTPKPARATVIFISNPSPVSAGGAGNTKGRSIASAVMTGASEAVRFAGSHGKDVH